MLLIVSVWLLRLKIQTNLIMILRFVWIFFLFISIKAYSQQYTLHPICEGVKTVHITDPIIARSLIVNYDPTSKKYVFLRCGDSDSEKLKRDVLKTCHIYKSGFEADLCQDEKNYLKLTQILKKGLEAGVGVAVTGGISEFSALGKAVQLIREARMNPDCLGLGLMRQLALYGHDHDLFFMYYDVQVKLLPFESWGNLIPKSQETPQSLNNKSSFVVQRLDYTLNPSMRNQPLDRKKIKLNGQPYFMGTLRKGGIGNLEIIESKKAEFCDFFESSGSYVQPQKKRSQNNQGVE